MRRTRTSLLLCMVGLTAVVTASRSHADEWRVSRHDQGRTGVASGPVNLIAPNIAWRTFMGGAPSSHSVRFVNEPTTATLSQSHAIIQRGGRFLAIDGATQATLWESEVLGLGQVAGIADLDGDGLEEVVVQTQVQAFVLDGLTGVTRWASSPELVETMGMTRVRDMDGDGLADVYIDNGYGAKYGVDAASAYSFATGDGVKLWDIPNFDANGWYTVSSGTDALLDLNMDGIPEVILPSYGYGKILDGATGAEITTFAAPVGSPFLHASALQANLDGVGADELVMVQQFSSTASLLGPAIYAFRVDVDAGTSELLWQVDPGLHDADFAATTDAVSDLDGDGRSEIIFSYRSPSAGDVWVTQVYTGDTGALLQQVVGARFEGAADLDGQPGSEVVMASDAGLSVYAFDATAATPLSQLGSTIPARRGVTMTDDARRATTYLDQRLAVLPRPGKLPLLIAGALDGEFDLARASSFASLDGYALVGGEWQLAASYEPLLGNITGLMTADYATRPYPQIAVGASTGVVDVLNQYMDVTNGWTWIDGTRLGVFVGGSYARGNPLVAHDAVGPFVVLPGTAIGTVVADARTASWIIPPLPRWWADRMSNPSVLDLGAGPTVVGVEDGALVRRDALTGAQAGSIEMPYGFPWGTPVALRTGASTLVGIDWRNYAGEIFQTAVDLDAGNTVFMGAPIPTGGFFSSSVGDLDQDGVDEWYSMTFASLWRRDASTGQASTLASLPDMSYALPMVTTSMTGEQSLLLQAGWTGPALVDASGAVAWQAVLAEPSNGMGGVVLSCGAAKRYITAGTLSSNLAFYDVATGALAATRTYAGGAAYADVDAAAAAGAKPGILSHVNGVASLDGAPAALVGSSDGHVYVIDPCSSDVRWAADLGASASEPIIADADGDGEDEILVAAANGFLYGLDDFSFPAPFITLSGEAPELPIVEVGVGESLFVSWDAVEGAASYEVALIGPDDKPVWSPAYRAADGTSFEVELTGALAARPYRVAVRVAGDDPGQEAVSKPILVHDVTPPSLTASAKGGLTSTVSFDASDDLALDVALLSVRAASGGDAVVVAEKLFVGAADVGELVWSAPASLHGESVLVSVLARDTAGLTSAVEFDAEVGPDGEITYASGDDGPDGPGGPEGPGGPGDVDDDLAMPQGCACDVPAGRTEGGAAVLALALALAVTGQRRRHGRRWQR